MARIKIDHTKCTGCRHCEIACSLNHVENTANPRRARIRVMNDMCGLCRASCPEKPYFIEAETGIPLKCDFCGIPPSPSCVRWCNSGALELVED